MTDLDTAFQTLAGHIEVHGARSYRTDLNGLAEGFGMAIVDQSDGFSTDVSYRLVHDGKRLRLTYLMIERQKGGLEHNFCLALSGRGLKGRKLEWRFEDDRPVLPHAVAG